MKLIRRISFVFAGTLATLALALGLATPAFANHIWFINSVTCDAESNTITISGTNGPGGSTDTVVYVNGAYLKYVAGPYGLVNTVFSDSDAAYVAGATVTVANSGTGTSATTTCVLRDSRINWDTGLAGPVALYCTDAGLEVWDIDPETGKGTLAFTFNGGFAKPTTNALLMKQGDIELWQLDTGEFQVNADAGEGKTYAFIFNGCPYDGNGYNANIDPNEK